MKYTNRIRYAAACSFLLHLCGLAAGAYEFTGTGPAALSRPEPLVISLKSPQTNELMRLVESGPEPDQAPRETDLISDHDSRARDTSAGHGETALPKVDNTADFEQLGRPPLAAAVPVAPPAQVSGELEPTEQDPATETANGYFATLQDEPDFLTPAEPAAQPTPPEQAPIVDPEPDNFDLAQAREPETMITQDFSATRGRESGGVEEFGATSFEANQHALGEYMLEIRKYVEREWRMMLQLKYSGSSRAYAVLKCSISPEGRLAGVEIIDAGASATYASMCKAAVERAGQYFHPFPFDVPEVFRTKNLEIQWKFTYM